MDINKLLESVDALEALCDAAERGLIYCSCGRDFVTESTFRHHATSANRKDKARSDAGSTEMEGADGGGSDTAGAGSGTVGESAEVLADGFGIWLTGTSIRLPSSSRSTTRIIMRSILWIGCSGFPVNSCERNSGTKRFSSISPA